MSYSHSCLFVIQNCKIQEKNLFCLITFIYKDLVAICKDELLVSFKFTETHSHNQKENEEEYLVNLYNVW